MPRADRLKASTALALRASGEPWPRVARVAGYADRESARRAAERELLRREEDVAARKVWPS